MNIKYQCLQAPSGALEACKYHILQLHSPKKVYRLWSVVHPRVCEMTALMSERTRTIQPVGTPQNKDGRRNSGSFNAIRDRVSSDGANQIYVYNMGSKEKYNR